ncbi:MAG: response regulator [Planctomyces sp.]|nr:response regulator [Planctomyces sp.]
MAMSGSVRVLLAEDDQGHASLIRRNLLRSGFLNEVVHVQDGQEALDFLYREGPFRERPKRGPLVVLLDINMPRIDGVQVLKQVKSDDRLNRLPVIMLTTTDDPREVEHCYALGCNLYVTKPIDYPAFVETLTRLGQAIEVASLVNEADLTESPG